MHGDLSLKGVLRKHVGYDVKGKVSVMSLLGLDYRALRIKNDSLREKLEAISKRTHKGWIVWCDTLDFANTNLMLSFDINNQAPQDSFDAKMPFGYEQIWSHIKVRIELNFYGGDTSRTTKNNLMTHWKEVIENVWNATTWQIGREGELPCRVSFEVIFTEGKSKKVGAHKTFQNVLDVFSVFSPTSAIINSAISDESMVVYPHQVKVFDASARRITLDEFIAFMSEWDAYNSLIFDRTHYEMLYNQVEDRRDWMFRWESDVTDDIIAHEFGHYLGFIDEYDEDTNLMKAIGCERRITNTIMGEKIREPISGDRVHDVNSIPRRLFRGFAENLDSDIMG